MRRFVIPSVGHGLVDAMECEVSLEREEEEEGNNKCQSTTLACIESNPIAQKKYKLFPTILKR